MKKTVRQILVTSILFLSLLITLIFIDRDSVGLMDSMLGLEKVNRYFFNLVVPSDIWNIISNIGMLISLMLIVVLALIGLFQLIKRKSLKKVDNNLISLGIGIIIMGIIWILFDKVLIINYRPIIIDNEIESSFPSTHIMITIYILLSGLNIIKMKINNKIVLNLFSFICGILIILTIIGRYLSGMHWITDILGGILLGYLLYLIYKIIGFKIKNR